MLYVMLFGNSAFSMRKGVFSLTNLISYSSGRTAVMVTNSSHGRPGHYTQLFNNNEKSSLLAVFTPTGKGSCYHPNGKVR